MDSSSPLPPETKKRRKERIGERGEERVRGGREGERGGRKRTGKRRMRSKASLVGYWKESKAEIKIKSRRNKGEKRKEGKREKEKEETKRMKEEEGK